MAAGFSVKDALNKNSKAGIDESPRARFRTKDISIFKMYRNDMNFYSVEQIEELAGDILMYGLKQNLELVYAPCEMGEYRIVAGERRWEALKYLVSKGYKEFELATSKLTTPQFEYHTFLHHSQTSNLKMNCFHLHKTGTQTSDGY